MRGVHVRLGALMLALLVALLATAAVGAAPADGPTATVSVSQSSFGPAQDVLVGVSITNSTRHTVRILRWFTPGDELAEPLLRVTRDGHPVAYTGPDVKRPGITGNDYVSLKAGDSVSRVIDLGAWYDLSESGFYEISYAVSSYDLFSQKSNGYGRKEVLTSDTVAVQVAGRGKGKPPPPPPPPPSNGNSFASCTTTQQQQLATARNDAKTYAVGAVTYLGKGISQMAGRYTTWFGTVQSTRYSNVTNHFNAISNAMATAPVTFDCSSKQNVYAYVYPNRPYTIYLGRVYWGAPATGTDSKAGTLIHEMSHFDVVAGTDDVVYGQAGAKSLALSNPDAAVTNADSHEYFAENTPALP